MMRMTCAATLLNAGKVYNALPQNASAVISCRIMPNQSVDEVVETIKKVLSDDEISITPRWDKYLNPVFPLSPSVMEKI